MMASFDQTLLIRALNSSRQLYFPSYVGLRLIGNQLSSGENDYLRKLVRRRLIAGDTWRFKPFKLYKGSVNTPQGIEHQYRDCLAPSPLTAVAEAFILMRFSETPAFDVSSRVYSYRWPPSNTSGGSYRYFFDGYKQRNTDIAAALKASNHIAVVTDLKQFYPSVNIQTVKSILKSRLSQSDIKSNLLFDGIYEFYSQLLESGGGGIPVGPASTHVLGHIILQDVDSELTSRYGNRYFRYVDDIVVVCHQRDEDVVKRNIQNCIENHGFAFNTEKTTVITGVDWHHHILRADGSDEDNLWQLFSDLAKNLAFHPDRADAIKEMLADEGLCIPVGRLLALSSYGPFQYFITRWKTPSVIIHAAKLSSMTNDSFLQRGKQLKKVYERSLLELVNAPKEKSNSFRRWQVQRAKRIINSLFYLRRFDEWENQSETFNAFPELVEQSALAKSLAGGVVNPILPFYGRGPAAFSELWTEHGQGYAVFKPSETVLNHAQIDGLITLRLYGTIAADSTKFLVKNEQFRLMDIVNRNSTIRSIPDLSFEDEFESLSLGSTDQEISTLARTRYSLSEGSLLEALSLLSSEYRS